MEQPNPRTLNLQPLEMDINYTEFQENGQVIMNTCLSLMKSNMLTDEKRSVAASSEMITNKLIDELILEVVADFHKANMTGCDDSLLNTKSTNAGLEPYKLINPLPLEEVKSMICPHCVLSIKTDGFGRHLKSCLQEKDHSRYNTRNTNSKKPTYNTAHSDDENYDIWNSNSDKSKSLKKLEQKKKKDTTKKNKNKVKADVTTVIDLDELDSQGSKNDIDVSCTPSPAGSDSASKESFTKKKIKPSYGTKGKRNCYETINVDQGSS